MKKIQNASETACGEMTGEPDVFGRDTAPSRDSCVNVPSNARPPHDPWTGRLYLLLLASGALVACGGDLQESAASDSEATASTSQPIVNGYDVTSNPFVAAVYHQRLISGQLRWWARPCTGTILRQNAGKTDILTARHCVTTDASYTSTNFCVGTQCKVTAALAPGVVPLGSTPPGVQLPAAPAAPTGGDEFDDIALVQVDGSLLGNLSAVAVNPGTMTTDLGPLTVYGYGRKEWYPSETDEPELNGGNPHQAGTLRWASGLAMDSVANSVDAKCYSYRHNLIDQYDGQAIMSGDSGGPTFAGMKLLGVHHQTGDGVATDVALSHHWNWLMSRMQWLTVRPLVGGSGDKLDVYNTTNFSLGAVVGVAPSGVNTADTKWTYGAGGDGLLQGYRTDGGTSYCADGGDYTSVILRNCDANAMQKWTVTDSNEIKNRGNGLCIVNRGVNRPVALGTCVEAGRWWGLSFEAAAPMWSGVTSPGVSLNATSAFTATRNTFTTVPYSSKTYDYGSNFDLQNRRFTAPYVGDYQVCASLASWVPSFELDLFVNGVRDKALAMSSNVGVAQGCRTVRLSAGQYVDVRVYQSTVASMSFPTNAYWNWMTVDLVRTVAGASNTDVTSYAFQGIFQRVDYSPETLDYMNAFDTSYHLFTAKTSRLHTVCASVGPALTAAFELDLSIGGARENAFAISRAGAATGCRAVRLAESQTLQVMLYQGSVGAMPVPTNLFWNWLTIDWEYFEWLTSLDNITSFSVPSRVFTIVPYVAELSDDNDSYNLQTSRYTAKTDGNYHVCASLASFAGDFELDLIVNGYREKAIAASSYGAAQGCRTIAMKRNDYLQIAVWQQAGSPMAFSPNTFWNWMTVTRRT